jgi:glucose-6-phosphate dehydrogenase assembly protein OpcA
MAGGSASEGIDVDGLERELSSMWAELTREKDGEDSSPSVMRACVLNLILYSQHDDREKIDTLLDEVTVSHPCRSLVLIADRETTEAHLNAYVSTRCQLNARGTKQICGEQVTIEAGGAVVERIASAVAPLLVPDVPVFLWWKDVPNEDDKLFNRLAEMSDRIVVDSASSHHPYEDLRRFSRMIAGRGGDMRASDLNWGRLTSWCAVVAHFWDVPDYRPYLDAIDRVRIDYDPPESAPEEVSAQALLVAGWLASRLGWQVETTGTESRERNKSTLMRAGERVINIEWRALKGVSGCERMISSLTFTSEETGAEFQVRWKQERTKLETSVKIGDEQKVSRVLAYEGRTDGERLSSELGILSRDVVYEQSLAAAAHLIETLRAREK